MDFRTGLLFASLAVEGVVLLGLLLWFAIRTASLRLRLRHVEPKIEAARTRLTRELVTGRMRAVDEGEELRPIHHQEALLRLATHLSGGSAARLRERARELGVVRSARDFCRSRLWWRRLRGIQLLDLLGVDDPAARRLLGDRHPRVRARAAGWLGELARGPDDVDALIEALDDRSPIVRFAAAEALLRVGHAAVAPIRDHMLDPTSEVPDRLMEVVAGLGSSDFLDPVVGRVRSLTPRGRVLGARYLGKVGGDAARSTLLELLGDELAEVRAEAAWSLGLLDAWTSACEIGRLLDDTDFDVRRSAGMALHSLGSPGTLVLRRAVREEGSYSGEMAMQVLDLPPSVTRRS